MSKQSQWKRQYGILRDFISSNPEIHISQSDICIPGSVRDGFHQCFDSVRGAFVDAWNHPLCFDVYSLSKYFRESERKLSELNLTIKLPSDLSSFLRNPREGMMRMIYSRLFELVQGKTTEDDFEWTARNDLVSGATDLFRIGYETWSALSLSSCWNRMRSMALHSTARIDSSPLILRRSPSGGSSITLPNASRSSFFIQKEWTDLSPSKCL